MDEKRAMCAACSRAISLSEHSMRPTAQQIERIARAFYKAALDKSVTPAKRLEFRMEARRGRALVRCLRKLKARRSMACPKNSHARDTESDAAMRSLVELFGNTKVPSQPHRTYMLECIDGELVFRQTEVDAAIEAAIAHVVAPTPYPLGAAVLGFRSHKPTRQVVQSPQKR